MSETFDAGGYLDAVAAALGLGIVLEHRPGVIANLERIAGMARLVAELKLPAEVEPAPVFRP